MLTQLNPQSIPCVMEPCLPSSQQLPIVKPEKTVFQQAVTEPKSGSVFLCAKPPKEPTDFWRALTPTYWYNHIGEAAKLLQQ